jgi:hypothetical protein
MRWHPLFRPAAALLAGTLAVSPGVREPVPAGQDTIGRRLEVARLRAHFDSVDAELHAAQPRLRSEQRAARVTLIGWLREYRNAGEFPRNDRYLHATPFFRDSQGILCAMAYLIARSGRRDLVDSVAQTRNNAFIAELADDADLRRWLDSVGLSVAEAGRIQPSYDFPGETDDQGVSTDYALTSILISGASLATIGLNLVAPTRPSGWAGVAAGTAGIIAGATNLDGNDGTQTVAVANMVVGGGAVAAGLYRLIDHRPGRGEAAVVVPTADGARLGFAVHATF